MNTKYYLFFLLFTGLISCKSSRNTAKDQNLTEDQFSIHAHKLAKDFIIVDGHVDLPYRLSVQNFRLEKEYLKIPIASEKGDFDYERSKAGGLDAPFMSIFIPARLQDEYGRSKEHAEKLIRMIQAIEKEHPDKFEIAHWAEDVKRIFDAGKIALPMGMENGSALEDDLDNIAYFKKRGISYITLTHSKDNRICDSSYDESRTWNGLSEFGRSVVLEMMRQGVMIDISHVSDSAFYQVLELAKVPLIASHSSCRMFTPGFERNMSDNMIAQMGENGGVIMINFGSSFLDKRVADHRKKMRNDIDELLEHRSLKKDDQEAKLLIDSLYQQDSMAFSDVRMVANHIDHVVELAGIDHVGFGSDFDGVGDSLPVGLKDVSQYPNLIKELLKRGYSDEALEKMCYKNIFRVWNEVERYSKKQSY
jgi:membrane dipeptidase